MKKTIIVLGISFLVAILAFITCSERINLGHEGILVNLYGSNRGASDVVLVSGRVWYNPITQSVIETPTTVIPVDYPPFTLNDADGTEFTVDPTLTLKVIEGSSPKIYVKYMRKIDDIVQNVLYGHVKDIYRIEFNKYKTDFIIANRNVFETNIQNEIIKLLDKEGFKFEQLTSGIKYPKALVTAIEQKNTAVQDAQRKENELKSVQIDGEKLIVQARAEAEANRLKQATLTPLLVQMEWINKWDGKSTQYGNMPNFFKQL